jgi:cytochrome c553
MKKAFVCAVALAVGTSFAAFAAMQADEPPPPWAWGFTTPVDPKTPAPTVESVQPKGPTVAPKDNPSHQIPGSKFTFTRAEVSNRYGPADWFPNEHPPMPEVVAHGRESAKPPINACSLCHMPDGRGRPENANLTGLPYDYIVRQLMDFKAGLRRTSDNRKTNGYLMEGFAQAMTEDEIKQAAAYFSSIPAPKWVKVVESDTAPKTHPSGGVFLTIEGDGAGKEPLGNRIIETPLVAADFELWRNPHSGFVAYVPRGSVEKGKALVTTGGGKVTPCTVCHGADLRGLGPVPRLAGRSPSYIARQLYDMKHGNRVGAWSPLMAPVVEKLNNDDMLVVSAYLASLDP